MLQKWLFSVDKVSFKLQRQPLRVFLRKSVLKIYSKFTGEHPCRSAISRKLLCNFIEIALRHGCSPVNLLHIFRTAFPKNTSKGLLLKLAIKKPHRSSCFTDFTEKLLPRIPLSVLFYETTLGDCFWIINVKKMTLTLLPITLNICQLTKNQVFH